MIEIAVHVVNHALSGEGLIIISNFVLAHVTWRLLPDEHRHSIRRSVRAIRGRLSGPQTGGA